MWTPRWLGSTTWNDGRHVSQVPSLTFIQKGSRFPSSTVHMVSSSRVAWCHFPVDAVGGTGRVSGGSWLHGAGDLGDVLQQRAGAHDLDAERLQPSTQLRVGGVDQRRRPMRVCVHQLHDSVIRSISRRPCPVWTTLRHWGDNGMQGGSLPSKTIVHSSPWPRASGAMSATILRAALARSRHQPSGSKPMTLLPSTKTLDRAAWIMP